MLEGLDRSHPDVEPRVLVPHASAQSGGELLGVPCVGESLEGQHDAVVVLLVGGLAVVLEHLGEDANDVLQLWHVVAVGVDATEVVDERRDRDHRLLRLVSRHLKQRLRWRYDIIINDDARNMAAGALVLTRT